MFIRKPPRTAKNKASALSRISAELAQYDINVGRVKNNDPFAASKPGSKGGTAPDALPNDTNIPRGAIESNVAPNVAAPTES